jgi:serine protease inhibitor
MSFDTPALTVAEASFGADLLRELCAAAPAQNIFTSPIGLFTALSLAYNGAAGPTRAAPL